MNPQELNSVTIDPVDLTVTISFKKEDENRMQLVYASQVYQTFFAVFAAFDLDRREPEALKLKGIYLQLINYKGLVNVGVIGVKNPINFEDQDGKGIEIKFKIKAGVASGILKYYSFNTPVLIKDSESLFFKRVLAPLEVDKSTGINTTFNIYDTEFYERDGLYNRKKTLRLDEDYMNFTKDGTKGVARWHKAPDRIDSGMAASIKVGNEQYLCGQLVEFKNMFTKKAPGGRCPKSKSIVKY